MIVQEVFIFIVSYIIVKYFWEQKRFFQLASKIPTISFSFGFLKTIIPIIFFKPNMVDFFDQFHEIISKSERISKIWFGPILQVFVTEAEDVKVVLNSKDTLDNPYFFEFINLHEGTIFATTVEKWQSHRKILNPYFGAQKLQGFLPIFNEKSRILLKLLENHQDKEEFDIFYYFSAYSLETILKTSELDVDIQHMKHEQRDSFSKNFDT
jgi:cytochrome P450 family 4